MRVCSIAENAVPQGGIGKIEFLLRFQDFLTLQIKAGAAVKQIRLFQLLQVAVNRFVVQRTVLRFQIIRNGFCREGVAHIVEGVLDHSFQLVDLSHLIALDNIREDRGVVNIPHDRDNDRQTSIILAVLGILPIVWLGLLIAPSVKGGLPEILPSLMNVMSDPFHIVLCEDSVKTVLVLLLCYGVGIGIYFSTRRNYRRREEHGSAKWDNAKAVDKKYRQNPPSENKLMTQAVRIGLNGKKHRRKLNTLVCGGSGAGKTRFYCKPNLMQANTSFVILDPNGKEVLGYILQAVH